MSKNFKPVETWIRYGLSDLYFGFRNQGNDVYRYGTFFYIMAAEKHLKALLIYEKRAQYESLVSIETKRLEVEKIVKGYSHKFEKMIKDVDVFYNQAINEQLVPDEYLGFAKQNLIKAMYEGYMETRYPSVFSTSRHFPSKKAKGIQHDPLGSSFFTDFMVLICTKCWKYLVSKRLNTSRILTVSAQ